MHVLLYGMLRHQEPCSITDLGPCTRDTSFWYVCTHGLEGVVCSSIGNSFAVAERGTICVAVLDLLIFFNLMALIQTANEKQKKEMYNTTSEGNLLKISFRSREADK